MGLIVAVMAGFIASLVGAAIWAGLTVATGYHIGYVAIGVGFLVGLAVRMAGREKPRLSGSSEPVSPCLVVRWETIFQR